MEMKMRSCRGGWSYCDGECNTCEINKMIYSNRSNANIGSGGYTYSYQEKDYRKYGHEVIAFTEEAICECGGKFVRRDNIALTTNPIQYSYICNNCGRPLTISTMYPKITYKSREELIDIAEEERINNMPDKEYAKNNSDIQCYIVDYTFDTGVSHESRRSIVFTNNFTEIKDLLSKKVATRSDECIESIDRILGISVYNNMIINFKD